MISNTIEPPLIAMKFDRNLLSSPSFRCDAEWLLRIAQWLEKKLTNRRFPSTNGKIREKIKQFMVLYERAKNEEKIRKGKRLVKAQAPFYRPRLINRNDQYLFDRLDDRRRISECDKRRNEVSKIRKITQ